MVNDISDWNILSLITVTFTSKFQYGSFTFLFLCLSRSGEVLEVLPYGALKFLTMAHLTRKDDA